MPDPTNDDEEEGGEEGETERLDSAQQANPKGTPSAVQSESLTEFRTPQQNSTNKTKYSI